MHFAAISIFIAISSTPALATTEAIWYDHNFPNSCKEAKVETEVPDGYATLSSGYTNRYALQAFDYDGSFIGDVYIVESNTSPTGREFWTRLNSINGTQIEDLGVCPASGTTVSFEMYLTSLDLQTQIFYNNSYTYSKLYYTTASPIFKMSELHVEANGCNTTGWQWFQNAQNWDSNYIYEWLTGDTFFAPEAGSCGTTGYYSGTVANNAVGWLRCQ